MRHRLGVRIPVRRELRGSVRTSRVSSSTEPLVRLRREPDVRVELPDPRELCRRTRANVAKCAATCSRSSASTSAASGEREQHGDVSRQAARDRGGEVAPPEVVDRLRRREPARAGRFAARAAAPRPSSAERVLDAPEEPAVAVVGAVRLLAEILLELLDQRALRLVEPTRDVDAGVHVEVAAPSAFEGRHALAAQHVDVARLGAGGNLDLDLAGRAGNRERRAERRLRHRQVDGRVEVVAVALDAGVRGDADLDEEVARRAGELAGVSLAANADPLSVGDAGGNVDVDGAVVQRAADAVAGGAR